eukprot:112095-Amphidinium_carterae.1
MLTQIRSYYNEGLLTCTDDIHSFIDFYDDHGDDYSRFWRLLLRWLSFQDIEEVINRFDQAMMLRGEDVDDVPDEEALDEGEESPKEAERRSQASERRSGGER